MFWSRYLFIISLLFAVTQVWALDADEEQAVEQLHTARVKAEKAGKRRAVAMVEALTEVSSASPQVTSEFVFRTLSEPPPVGKNFTTIGEVSTLMDKLGPQSPQALPFLQWGMENAQSKSDYNLMAGRGLAWLAIASIPEEGTSQSSALLEVFEKTRPQYYAEGNAYSPLVEYYDWMLQSDGDAHRLPKEGIHEDRFFQRKQAMDGLILLATTEKGPELDKFIATIAPQGVQPELRAQYETIPWERRPTSALSFLCRMVGSVLGSAIVP